ncbi:hypothetical protein JOB18_019669 [Solea senegalensis]|uniref:Uncharacterized protein n=1 Tax=Solea senegalensis TaxID=28829 RepID=A0AAV6RNB0_SOLSE|nr:hypothetical protein JOB18_019669 [Solea senegalensis]
MRWNPKKPHLIPFIVYSDQAKNFINHDGTTGRHVTAKCVLPTDLLLFSFHKHDKYKHDKRYNVFSERECVHLSFQLRPHHQVHPDKTMNTRSALQEAKPPLQLLL